MNRIYHTWDKWECFPAGLYDNRAPEGMSREEAETIYKNLLSDCVEFGSCLELIINEWHYSCEHYLSNEKMNRIAWLGQAALAYKYGIPAMFRNGYNLLDDDQQIEADKTALVYLNTWLTSKGDKELTLEEAGSKTVANLY